MGFVQRAFTPGGGEAPEAVAQRASAQARIDTEAAVKAAAQLKAPEAPKPPPGVPMFSPGQTPGGKARAAQASTLLGVGAAAGQLAGGGAGSVLGTGSTKKSTLG